MGPPKKTHPCRQQGKRDQIFSTASQEKLYKPWYFEKHNKNMRKAYIFYAYPNIFYTCYVRLLREYCKLYQPFSYMR